MRKDLFSGGSAEKSIKTKGTGNDENSDEKARAGIEGLVNIFEYGVSYLLYPGSS